jgi:glycosyltransferase involved in cell wall biosynthesis
MMTYRQTGKDERKLRVCFVIPKLEIGGAEFEVLCLAKHLDKSRFDLSLLCLSPGLDEMELEAKTHLETFAVAGFRSRYLPFSLARMVRWLARGHYDVIHCHMPMADVIGRIAGWVAGIPVIVTTEHGKFLGKPWYHVLLERALNPITDMRICVSEDILAIRHKREGTPLSKLVRIPNAVETERFRGPHRNRAAVMAEFGWEPLDPLVVSVGRLEPEKNYALLIEAMERVISRFPRAKCLIVGGGSCREELRARVESSGLASHVTLPGPRSDIPDLLSAADVFALSSLKEGLPVALLEAMAAGRAVVVTSVGGMPEAITNGDNGFVVPADSAERLAGAIGSLLDDKGLRVKFGEAARAKAERDFSIDQVAHRIAALYTDLYRVKAGKTRGRPADSRSRRAVRGNDSKDGEAE